MFDTTNKPVEEVYVGSQRFVHEDVVLTQQETIIVLRQAVEDLIEMVESL